MAEGISGNIPVQNTYSYTNDETVSVVQDDENINIFENKDEIKKDGSETEPTLFGVIYNVIENYVVTPIKEALGFEKTNIENVAEVPVENPEIVPEKVEQSKEDINAPVQESDKLTEEDKKRYNFDFEEKLSDEQKEELTEFTKSYNENIEKYKEVEELTSVPSELVASIHWRESSGDFDSYLHNGDELGKETINVPVGIYFDKGQWTEAAVDALKREDTSVIDKNDERTFLKFAELYNGMGYFDRNADNPYLYAGTSNYTSGKYTYDGHYDPDYIDTQLGIAVMLKALKNNNKH